MFNKVIECGAPRTQYLDLVFLLQTLTATAKGCMSVPFSSPSYFWNALKGFLLSCHKHLLMLHFKLHSLFVVVVVFYFFKSLLFWCLTLSGLRYDCCSAETPLGETVLSCCTFVNLHFCHLQLNIIVRKLCFWGFHTVWPPLMEVSSSASVNKLFNTDATIVIILQNHKKNVISVVIFEANNWIGLKSTIRHRDLCYSHSEQTGWLLYRISATFVVVYLQFIC